ncbi:MAG: type III polyketide synthase [Planctomycetes bacterium]|nr:type III polyketide synthase [Planctomycetota bacterium]
MSVRIESMGFATPALSRTQRDIGREQSKLWNLKASSQDRWERMIDHCGIERRAAVMPLDEIVTLTTAQRMQCFARHAPALAARAVAEALARAGRSAGDITDLIVVTCTGFESPGPIHDLCVQAGLPHRVRTSQIGFMGCFGGICGLDAAAGAALRHEGAVVLLVCVELCSLHLRDDRDVQNMVASLLFADGAAAVVVSRGEPGRGGAATVGPRFAMRVPGTADAMSWKVTDAGFAMTLDRGVPEQLERAAPAMLGDLRQCAIHPGGAAILDAMERGANARACGGLAPESLSAARGVLRDHGNMSSGSVFFVLDRLLEGGATGELAAIAFGPGLTVDRIDLCAAPPAVDEGRLAGCLVVEAAADAATFRIP